jgi:hypothetical protein
MYEYTMDVKNPVRRTITRKTLNSPKVNETISLFDFVFRLKATNMGITGRIQGDNIEITPVKKEIRGNISIYISLSSFRNSSASTYP